MGFAEKLRLLYVACTRARDHLVVSVHRLDRTLPDDDMRFTAAELLWSAAHDAAAGTRRAGSDSARAAADHRAARRDGARDVGGRTRPRVRDGQAPALRLGHRAGELGRPNGSLDDPGLAKEGRDLELPPWNKGRYGTAIGRAVHAVLQTVDLATGAGLADLAAAQAAAEGVIGFESTIAALVQSAIGSDTVRAACAGEYWRETYVAVPAEGLTLEGYVDLVYRDARDPGETVAASSWSTTRPTRSPTKPASTRGSRTMRCKAPRTRSRSRRRPANASIGACSCSSRRVACSRSRSKVRRWPPRSPTFVRSYRQFRDDPPAFEPVVLAEA